MAEWAQNAHSLTTTCGGWVGSQHPLADNNLRWLSGLKTPTRWQQPAVAEWAQNANLLTTTCSGWVGSKHQLTNNSFTPTWLYQFSLHQSWIPSLQVVKHVGIIVFVQHAHLLLFHHARPGTPFWDWWNMLGYIAMPAHSFVIMLNAEHLFVTGRTSQWCSNLHMLLYCYLTIQILECQSVTGETWCMLLSLHAPLLLPHYNNRAANPSQELSVIKSVFSCNDRILGVMHMFW